MEKRYFWRRILAYVVDLVLLTLVVSILASALNPILPVKLIVPLSHYSSACETRNDISTQAEFIKLLPKESDQIHTWKICRQNNMFISRTHVTILSKSWPSETATRSVDIGYVSDKNGHKINAISLLALIYLLAPFVFAVLQKRFDQTPGKAIFSLTIRADNSVRPTIWNLLIREYLKGGFLIAGAVTQIQLEASMLNKSVEELVYQDIPFAQKFTFWHWFEPHMGPLSGVTSIFAFYFFCYFIAWQGRAFWDMPQRLTVVKRML